MILSAQKSRVTSAVWSPDSKRILTIDRTARVWHADGTGEALLLKGYDSDNTLYESHVDLVVEPG